MYPFFSPVYLFLVFACLFVLVQVIWYGRLFLYSINKKGAMALAKPEEPSISIIVAARNESENLLRLIPLLFQQNYPHFEVIVVDDCSYDNTHDVLLALKAKYANFKFIKVVESNKFLGGKKFALTMGIKGAKFEHLVFTDADCEPASDQWLKEISQAFSNDKNIVLGFGGFKPENKLVNYFIRTDANFIAIDYMAAALWKMPYMAVGRNLAYKKDLFFKVKGFASHIHLPSGDDDLFIHQTSKYANVGINFSTAGATITEAKKSFIQWYNQKRRHVSTFKYYSFSKKALIGFLWVLKVVFYFSFLMSLVFSSEQITNILIIYLGAMLLRVSILFPILKKINQHKLLIAFVILEPCILILQFIFPVISLLIKEVQWKSLR